MRIHTFLILFIFWALFAYSPVSVSAASFSPSDVISAVNALRAGRGLPPYQVDSELNAYAQQHAEYQAKINFSTHQHSDGSTAQSRGIQENIAAGDNGILTVNIIVNQIWADPIHMQTMVGNSGGYIGAGVAANSSTTYVTLNVRPGNDSAPAQAMAVDQAGGTPQPIAPLVTNTPGPDGSIVHIVGYGQSLWEIAISYGLTIDQIRGLNGISGDTTSIYAGQRLVLRLPVSATPTILQSPTVTETPTPSRTPSPSPTRLPPKATRSATASPQPAHTSFAIELLSRDTKTLGISLIIFAGIGLVLVLYFGFHK